MVTFDDVVGFSAFGAEFFGLGSTSFFFQKKKKKKKRGNKERQQTAALSPLPLKLQKTFPSSGLLFDLCIRSQPFSAPITREHCSSSLQVWWREEFFVARGGSGLREVVRRGEEESARKKTGSAKKKKEIQFCRCSHKFLSPPLHSSSSSSTSSTPPKTHSQWPSPRKPSSRRSSR